MFSRAFPLCLCFWSLQHSKCPPQYAKDYQGEVDHSGPAHSLPALLGPAEVADKLTPPARPVMTLEEPALDAVLENGTKVVLVCTPKDRYDTYELEFMREMYTAPAHPLTGRLTFERFYPEEDGIYHCMSRAGEVTSRISNAMRLVVGDMLVNMPRKPTLQLEEWDACHLECAAAEKEEEKVLAFSLYKGTVLLERVPATKEGQRTGSLNVARNGAGVYTCTLETKDGESTYSEPYEMGTGVCGEAGLRAGCTTILVVPVVVKCVLSLLLSGS